MRIYFKYKSGKIESVTVLSLLIFLATKTDCVYDGQIGIINNTIELSILVDYNIG